MPLLAANRRALARFPEVLAGVVAATPGPFAVPAEEEAAFVAHTVALRRTLVVLTGVPGPTTIAALLHLAPREMVFWCIEPAAAPFAARCEQEDLSAWLGDPRVFISIGPPADFEIRRLNRELAWVNGARAVPLPSRCPRVEEPWRGILTLALARIQQRWQNVYTDLHLSPVRFENTCANLDAFLDQPWAESLAQAFAGATLVLVAAGPSLDDALPFLRRIHDRAIVVTGNTSFRALASRGIPPHLTVSVDPFPSTDLGYANQPTAHSHLIAPVFVNPSVLPRFTGRLFGLADESKLLARLRRVAGLPPPPAIVGEGTVSATIVNLAAHLGCTRVVFVGQDFAAADDGRSHASDTFYTDLGQNRQEDEQVHRLPGTTRAEVTVPSRLRWYLRTVETLISRLPGIRFLNTSHQGAAIAGAPYLDYEAAAALLEAVPPRDFAAELAARHATAPTLASRPAIATELGRARTAMNEALRLSLAAALANEFALVEPNAINRRRFDTAAQRFEQWRSTRATDQELLFDGRTKAEIFAAEKRRLQIPLDAADRPLREAGELAWAFAEGAADLHRQLQSLELAS